MIPKHIAIIMDGNGRWAKAQNLPRFRGHLEGVKRVEEIAEAAGKMGVKALTLYTFSTENWRRPKDEVDMLMRTLTSVLQQKMKRLIKDNVKVMFIGRREDLSGEVLKTIQWAEEMTSGNTGLILNVAFNYGSRAEILDAVQRIAHSVRSGELNPEDIDEEFFGRMLYTKDLPDPDLLIRTSGEQRISNFLLWQLSYAELYFTEKPWPEFGPQELERAVAAFQKRERRYGDVSAGMPH